MSRLDINEEKLAECWNEFYMNQPNHLRFGQWIMNKYGQGSWPELYYCENNKLAYKMALEEVSSE